MAWFDWSVLLPFVTIASVALSVAVAVMGLRSGHYNRGKLTRRGRRIVAAIIMLGLVTLASTIADQRITATKEAQDARSRAEQFERQMAALTVVTGRIDSVGSSLRNSIDRQEQLYDVAQQNLQMSDELQTQARQSTIDLLRRMFEESNRVSLERVAVEVHLTCPIGTPPAAYPRLEAVQVAVEGDETELSLVSRVSIRASDALVFHNFIGDIGRFEAFSAWRDARVRLRMTGLPRTPADLDQVDEQARGLGAAYAEVRCPILVRLYLNGRQVLSHFGYMERAGDYFYLAEFEDLRVDTERLPQF